MVSEACMVRRDAARKCWSYPVGKKDAICSVPTHAIRRSLWGEASTYFHLVAATMAGVMFGAMCRCNDASHLRWRNIRFESDGSSFEITFEKGKNAQFRQVNKVVPSAAKPDASVCPALLHLRSLQSCYLRHETEDNFVFRGFNGCLV